MSDPAGDDHLDGQGALDQASGATSVPEQLSVLPVTRPGPSGVVEVDAALAALSEVADRDFGREGGPGADVEAYEQAHAHLQRALTGGVEAQADADR